MEPIEQRDVEIGNTSVTAVLAQAEGGAARVYVPLGQVCEAIGLHWPTQRRAIENDPILSQAIKGVTIAYPPSADGRGGGPQTAQCLPLEMFHGWIFRINANRVKRDDVREGLIMFQREAYDVLFSAFYRAPTSTALDRGETAAMFATVADVRAFGLALARLAEEQTELGVGVRAAHDRLDDAARYVAGASRDFG